MAEHTRFRRKVACLDCGYPIDAATAAGEHDRRPKKGDVGLCFQCGHIMIYADRAGTLRRPTEAELIDLAGDPLIVAVNNHLAAFRRAFPEAFKDG